MALLFMSGRMFGSRDGQSFFEMITSTLKRFAICVDYRQFGGQLLLLHGGAHVDCIDLVKI